MFKIYVDGASRGNPGKSAIGFIIIDENGVELYRYGKKIGHRTNNYAEYKAIIEALKYLKESEALYKDSEVIYIYSDSALLVNQMRGKYRVKSKKIAPLFQKAKELLKDHKGIHIDYIKREKNRVADWIVNRVLDGKSYRPVDRSRECCAPEESPGS